MSVIMHHQKRPAISRYKIFDPTERLASFVSFRMALCTSPVFASSTLVDRSVCLIPDSWFLILDSWISIQGFETGRKEVNSELIVGKKQTPKWQSKRADTPVAVCLALFNHAERIKADSQARESTRCFINVINMLPTSSHPDLGAKPLASAEAGDPALTQCSRRSI